MLNGRLRSVVTLSNGKKELDREAGRGELMGVVSFHPQQTFQDCCTEYFFHNNVGRSAKRHLTSRNIHPTKNERLATAFSINGMVKAKHREMVLLKVRFVTRVMIG